MNHVNFSEIVEVSKRKKCYG